jgi:hypothetical protein
MLSEPDSVGDIPSMRTSISSGMLNLSLIVRRQRVQDCAWAWSNGLCFHWVKMGYADDLALRFTKLN